MRLGSLVMAGAAGCAVVAYAANPGPLTSTRQILQLSGDEATKGILVHVRDVLLLGGQSGDVYFFLYDARGEVFGSFGPALSAPR